MKYKKIMLILITAIFLASIAGVSAGDAEDAIAISEDAEAMEVAQSDEMTASDDSNAMEQSDDEELILEDNDVDKPILGEGASTGSFTELNDLINNQYSSNDTITLSCNYTFNGTDDDDSGFIHGISINRAVTIDGKGCTIDGSQKARIFNIGNGGSVKFLNINFINGKATGSGWEVHGGAIIAVYRNCVVECCNFTNNTADDQGGALMRVTAYNCTFTGNQAAVNGGAILQGSAYNSIFTGNTAKYGGAIYGGSAYNCVFTGNTANNYGGAIYYGSAYNCTFTGNTAIGGDGGAMWGDSIQPEMFNATLCMFDSNTPDDYRYIRIVNAVLSADNLTTSYKSGDRLLFNLTADNTNYVGFNTTIKIYQDEQEIGTYYALSGEGWIVDLNPGTYKAVLSLDKYAGVTHGVATITVMPNNTFWALNQKINGNDKNEINLTNDYYYDPAYDSAFTDGIRINRPVTINGNGHTIDAKGQARIFYVGCDNVTINNVTFVNGKRAGGGAIYWYGANGAVSGSSFTGNTAEYGGGAIYWYGDNGAVSGSSFTGNHANYDGGAIYWKGVNGNVSNSIFINNTANMDGDAIYGNRYLIADYCWFGGNATNYLDLPIAQAAYCNYILFLNATANPAEVPTFSTSEIVFKLYLYNNNGNISEYDNTLLLPINLTITSTNGDVDIHTANLRDSIRYTATGVGDASVTATIENAAYTIALNNIMANPNLSVENQVITYGENATIALNYNTNATGKVNITLTGKKGTITYTNLDLNATIMLPDNIPADEYNVTVSYSGDENFMNATANATLSVNKANSTLTINDNVTFDYGTNGSTTVSYTNATGVNASVVGQPNAIVVVNDTTITVSGLNAGNYTLTVTTITDANHNNITRNATITVNKLKTELTGNAIATTYNIDKNLVITLKDANGKALSGFKVTVDLNGAKTYTTDKNGQVKVSTKGLAPKTYTAKVTFNGNTNYDKSTKDIKVTVKKATPKLTAKKKTFKSSVKTKKYTVVLKDNTGKAIKKAKVTLKVKGKTYKATTNSKGKAVFKIKNLKKKGKYTAVIKFKGNKYYNKATKKAKIKVIVTFKTVSKGSKDKSTVKEIQQALKDKGYYLSYKGHYLMVDGKFESCTERSVKEFQHDKGLKVTGKVDEKTAKKLGLI